MQEQPTTQVSLTKEEALQALSEGKRVKHRYFTGHDYMFLVDKEKNIYKFEDGVEVEAQKFWYHRPGAQYLTGWYVVS